MIALFCGSRGWADEDAIGHDLVRLPPDTIVIHGNAKGADRLADGIARKLGLHVAVVAPLYDTYPTRTAPLLRNEAMLRLGPDVVYAYNLGTPGTSHMIELAESAGVLVYERTR